MNCWFFFFFQAEDGIRDHCVTGVQTCALPISRAIRIARGTTGRETIVKIFGSYHGHHDGVMVSIGVEYDQIGDHENLASLPYGAGIPQAVVDLTIPVPFNDAGAMERRIERLTE